MIISTVADFEMAMACGQYAWPGGYPCYFVMSDGETMSFAAAAENATQIKDAIATQSHDGWRAIAYDINWEDNDMICCHSGEPIEAAYASEEESNV
jgi:hypothetical protein